MTDHIEAVEAPQELPNAWELLAEEIDNQKVEDIAKAWATNPQHLKESLWYLRRQHANAQSDIRERLTQVAHLRGRFDGIQVMRDRDQKAVRMLLEQKNSGEQQIGFYHPIWLEFFKVGFQVGILAGYAGETHRLAIALNEHEDTGNISELWDTVSREARTPEGTYPNPVSIEEAAGRVWRYAGNNVDIHPADPRLDNGWMELWKMAKSEDLCEVFDTIALVIGIEKPQVTKSGTVEVRFSGTVDVPVEGWDGDDIWEVISEYDIRDAISNNNYGTYIEMDDADYSGLDWD